MPPGKPAKPGQIPLERALSKRGLASRTIARRWIEAGRVRVNGVVRRHPLFPVDSSKARIEIDGEPAVPAPRRTFLLHKPRGTVTTRADEKNRPTALSLVREEGLTLHAVGRLDLATTGLLILTNDTALSSWLTDPVNEIPRIYLVTVRGLVTEEERARIEGGRRIDGELLRAHQARVRKASRKESHLVLELREGKNREIRKLLADLGHEVTRLKRVAYGGLELGRLGPGEYRELSAEELARAFPRAPIAVSSRSP